MVKYPKLLSWIATRNRVEDDQAKALWLQVLFMARIFNCADDHEFLMEQFITRVKTLSWMNKQVAKAMAFKNPILS